MKWFILITFLLMFPIVQSIGSIELPARIEYKTGETMTLYTQVLNETGVHASPVDNATCTITIYYPNRTVWVSNENLTHLSDDIYYFNKTLGDESGVYVYEVNCSYPVIHASAEIFHVGAEWVNEIGDIKQKTDLLDDIKDNTDKIPAIRNTLNFVTSSLQNLGISQRNSFLYAFILLILIIVLIVVTVLTLLWNFTRVKVSEVEEETTESEGWI
ncbi:MAG: hypothetical protein ACE5KD_00950 [Candidatus Bathyarchaeia archaeon]